MIASERRPVTKMTDRPANQSQLWRIASWLLLAAWVAVIWGHSLVPAASSDAESLAAVDALSGLFELLHVSDRGLANHLVRKSAHFNEYLLLALLTRNAARFERPRVSRKVVALLWVLVPVVDELIQRFVPGRSGQLSDVLLDMCGYGLGVLAGLLLERLIQRVRPQRS